MRKPIMAGNWKMNKTRDEAIQFMLKVAENVPSSDKLESIVCAPAIILRDLVKRQGDNLRIGAQNMHEKDSGAFTGEISPVMLTSTGVTYVILGHSERRQYFNETDAKVNEKTLKALESGLTPIVCVGEALNDREDGLTNNVLERQVTLDLKGLTKEQVENVIIAYEPIWAIGTGKTADSKTADDACGFIRALVAKLYDETTANKVRVLYGGSVNTKNVAELMSMPNIDGGLVGGASLKEDDFITLCNEAVKAKY